MPKDRDRASNPATLALKAQKTRDIKKSKAAALASRTEKLARRNPDRLQKQINELQEQKGAQGGTLRPKDQQNLEQLERDLRIVRRARESQREEGGGVKETGVKREDAPGGRGAAGDDRGTSSLGKRPRDAQHARRPPSPETDTDEDVRSIPMPSDAPPPIPPRHLQRKIRKGLITTAEAFAERDAQRSAKDQEAEEQRRKQAAIPAKKTYESAPQLRDLTKEATAKFVPAAVAAKARAQRAAQAARRGEGRLLEPEEVEGLEREEFERQREREQRNEQQREHGRGVDDDNRGGVDNGGGDAKNDVEMFEEEERRLLAELGESAKSDARSAANAAEKEAKFEMVAQGGVPDVEAALGRAAGGDDAGGALEGGVGEEARRDAKAAADEAEKEAEYEIMATDMRDAGDVERKLRRVEMEEVSDEEAGGVPAPPKAVEEDEEEDFW